MEKIKHTNTTNEILVWSKNNIIISTITMAFLYNKIIWNGN